MAQPSSVTPTCGTKPPKARLSNESLRQRLAQEGISRELKAQAERLVNEEIELEKQREEEERQGVSGRPRRSDERRRTKLQARRLRLLEGDDEGVIEILKRDRRIDHIRAGTYLNPTISTCPHGRRTSWERPRRPRPSPQPLEQPEAPTPSRPAVDCGPSPLSRHLRLPHGAPLWISQRW